MTHNVMLVLNLYLKNFEDTFLQRDVVGWLKETFLVRDTMNGSSDRGPLSSLTKSFLKKRKGSQGLFHARYGSNHMLEPKSQPRSINVGTGLSFSVHDLRCTFATHAHLKEL